MDQIIKKLEDVLIGEDGFLIKLRFQEGYDEAKFQELLVILEEMKHFYLDSNQIPKYLTSLMLDVYPCMFSSLESYDLEQKEKINLAMDKLSAAFKDCLE